MLVKDVFGRTPPVAYYMQLKKIKEGKEERRERKRGRKAPILSPSTLLRLAIPIWDLVLKGFGSKSRILFLQF